MKLILASASLRRAQLLQEAGYAFEVQPADVDEKQISAGSPSEFAQRLAVMKAEAVAEKFPDDVILGADTIVCLGEQMMGKPENAEDARRMLELLSGTTQIVITGVCIIHKSANYMHSTKVLSAVRMDNLNGLQIDQYIASGEWQGKAGSYGLQDKDPFVRRIAGSHSNIVGLPMEQTSRMLALAGIKPDSAPAK